jgi:hypothetical protein
MGDTIFDLATGALSGCLDQTSGIPIVYERWADGEILSFSATAQMSKTSESVIDSDGAVVEYEVVDFIMKASDLVLAGVVTVPIAGDRVTLADGRLFEVSKDVNLPPYRWSDSNHKRIRVHTKPQGLIGVP